MNLSPTPDVRADLIRVGTAIRKSPEILRAYLAHLEAQVLPPNTRVEYHFVLDTQDPEACQLIHDFVGKHGGMVDTGEPSPTDDFCDTHPVTHQWSTTAMARVGQMKNRILQQALQSAAVAVWFVDADLLCDPKTLRSLWYADKPIVHGVFWTRWNPQSPAQPQVWLQHPYTLAGRGYPDEAAFRRRLLTKQLTQVWGGGACTLIRRGAIEAGVNYTYLTEVPLEGMMAGEDRHFCLRAEHLHIPMFADPWPHIAHIYHPTDVALIPEAVRQIHCPGTDWLSIHIKLLEPLQVGPGQFKYLEPVVFRFRTGKGEVLPDLEAQCLKHLDGQTFVASIAYPLGYPVAVFRGTTRLAEVTVVDYKSRMPQPVLNDDIPGGIDLTDYLPEQLEAVHE